MSQPRDSAMCLSGGSTPYEDTAWPCGLTILCWVENCRMQVRVHAQTEGDAILSVTLLDDLLTDLNASGFNPLRPV